MKASIAMQALTAQTKNIYSNRSGFSLAEIMIVVATTAILAAIAITSFQGYIRDARAAEATLMLARAHQDLKAFKDGYGYIPASLEKLWGNHKPDSGGKFLYGFYPNAGNNDPFCKSPLSNCYTTYDESDPNRLNGVDQGHISFQACLKVWACADGTKTCPPPANPGMRQCTFPTTTGFNPRTDVGITPPYTAGAPQGYDFAAIGDIDNDETLHKIFINEMGVVWTACDDTGNFALNGFVEGNSGPNGCQKN